MLLCYMANFYKKNYYDLLQHLVYLDVPSQLKFQQDQLARWATEWHYNHGRPPPCTLCPHSSTRLPSPPIILLDPKFIWANFCQLTKFFITKSFFYHIIFGFSDFVCPLSLCLSIFWVQHISWNLVSDGYILTLNICCLET